MLVVSGGLFQSKPHVSGRAFVNAEHVDLVDRGRRVGGEKVSVTLVPVPALELPGGVPGAAGVEPDCRLVAVPAAPARHLALDLEELRSGVDDQVVPLGADRYVHLEAELGEFGEDDSLGYITGSTGIAHGGQTIEQEF